MTFAKPIVLWTVLSHFQCGASTLPFEHAQRSERMAALARVGSRLSTSSEASSDGLAWARVSDDSWRQQRGSTVNRATGEGCLSTEESCLLPANRRGSRGPGPSAGSVGMRNRLNNFLAQRRGHIRSRRWIFGRCISGSIQSDPHEPLVVYTGLCLLFSKSLICWN